MPSIEDNRRLFGQDYDWRLGGEEWSVAWGGPDMQWFGTLLPRLHDFLPAARIVEIAPGFGRWTHYLKHLCDELIGVDIAHTCVEACRQRFSAEPHMHFFLGDGSGLPMAGDGSVDLVFSFDSLVHADDITMASYLRDIARVLKPNGIAWLHHSNLGAYAERMQEVEDTHGRDHVMSAEKARRFAAERGLHCIGQELINWGTERALIDAISLFCRPGSDWLGEGLVIENPHFMEEVHHLRRAADIYCQDHLRHLQETAQYPPA